MLNKIVNTEFYKMKCKIAYRWLLLLIPSLTYAQAQENYFSLKDAVQYGIEHHLIIQKSDYELDKYNQKFREQLSGYLPQIKADAAYTNNLRLITQIIPGEFLGQPGKDQAVQFGTKYNASASIELTQTLVDFEKISRQKIARQNRRIGLLDKQKTIEQVIYDVSIAYTAAQVTFLQQAVILENVQKVDTLLANLRVQVANGFAGTLDMKRLQLERSNLQTQLQNAQVEYRQSTTLLKYTMTYPLEDTLTINTLVEQRAYSPLIGEQPPARSVDIQLATARRELSALNLKQAELSYLPKLSFNFKYGALAQQNHPNVFREGTNWYPNSLASLNLSIPIFDGNFKASKVKQSQLELRQSELDLKISENEQDKDLRNASAELAASNANLITTKQSMALAGDVYKIAYVQFQKGYTSLKDLLDTHIQLKETQTAYLKAIVEVQSAELEWQKASGNIALIIK